MVKEVQFYILERFSGKGALYKEQVDIDVQTMHRKLQKNKKENTDLKTKVLEAKKIVDQHKEEVEETKEELHKAYIVLEDKIEKNKTLMEF